VIHIIGTAHSRTQWWSDAIRANESLDTNRATVEQFESYVRETANSLRATAIAEELSKHIVDSIAGGVSVAKKVADELRLCHLFCDPDEAERRELRIETNHRREAFWLARVQALRPNNTSVIFVCGANHSSSFCLMLERHSIDARIHCRDWMLDH
jgi:hypothetical protein